MANRIKLTNLVDIDLAAGKVNFSKLEQELPKLLQQAFAKLPGAKALVSPELEINPRFNTQKVLKQLQALPNDLQTRLARTKSEITDPKALKGYEDLEKAVAKYSRALEHLSSVTANAKFDDKFLNKVKGISEGMLPSSAVPQKRIQEYRNYLSELQKTWGQIQREFGNINDKIKVVPDPTNTAGLRNSRKRLRTAQDRLVDIDAQLKQDGLKPEQFEKLKTSRAETQKKIINEQAAIAGFEEQRVEHRRTGATLSQEVEDIRRSVAGQIKQLDQILTGYTPNLAEMQKDSNRTGRFRATARKNDERAAEQLRKAEFAAYREDEARTKAKASQTAKELAEAQKDANRTGRFRETARKNDERAAEQLRKAEFAAYREDQAREKAKADKAAKELAEAQRDSNRNFKSREADRKSQEFLDRHNVLGDRLFKLIDGRSVSQLAALPGYERAAITRASNKYLAGLEQLRDSGKLISDADKQKLEANYKGLLRFIDDLKVAREEVKRSASKSTAQSDRLQTLGRARALTDNLAPQATKIKELRQEFSTWDRQKLEELKVLVAQERRILDEMVKQGYTDEARLKRLGDLKRRISEAERKLNSKEAEVPRAAKAAFMRGQDAYKAAGGDPNRIPLEYRRDARDYLGQRIDIEQAKLDAKTIKLGPNAAEVRTAAKEIEHLREAYYRLNEEAKRSHPIWHQAGLLIAQFLRYAIGYGALYKMIQGLQDLGRAAINLQDDLKGIQAITGSTAEEMLGMKAVIEEVATTSAFRIDDIAAAVRTVVQAGIDLKEVPKAVKAVSDLATASGTSLQTAADIITTAQAVWDSVSPEEIANKVTQAANVSKLAVEDLQSIFNYGASFAENANISLDQFLAQTAALKNAGRRPSTIGTGLSQLYKEAFAPDDKFAQFVSDQYATIGERMSTRQVRNKFASFTETADPMREFVQEMIRINANTPEALGKLQRSMDQRSIRALTPLLNNPNGMSEINARMAAAPTAAEAAAVAMDSLKKSAGNLRDQIEVLADKLFNPMLEPITQVVNKLTEFAEALGHMVDRAKDNTESTGMLALGSGALAGAVAGWRRTPGYLHGMLKPAGALAGAALGGTAFLADRAQASIGVPDIVRTIGDAIFDIGIYKLITRAFKAKAATGAAEAAAPLGARALAFGKSLIEPVIGFISGVFGRLGGTALLARLAPLAAMAASIPGVIIAAVAAVLTAAVGAVLYKLHVDKDKEKRKLSELDTGFTAKDSSQLATQEAERIAESNQASTKYAKSFPDQPAPDESLEGKVRLQRQNIGRFLASLRSGLGVEADQPINVDEAISRTKAIHDFRGTDQERQTLLKKLQQDLGGKGAIDQEALKDAQNTASTLVAGITALADSLTKDYVELLRKEGQGTLDKEGKKELGLFRRLSDKGKTFFASLIDTGRMGAERPTEATLAAVENLANTGRQYGLKTPEQESSIAKDAIVQQVVVAANAKGTPQAEYEQNQLKIRLRDQMQSRTPEFNQQLATAFSRLLTSKDARIRETAASVFDLVLTGLKEGLEKNKRDLEGVGKEAGELRSTDKPITLENQRGETTTMPGTKARDLLTTTAPRAVSNLTQAITAVDQIVAEKDLAAKSKRYAQFSETLAPLVSVGEGNQRQTNLANFLNLIGKAEGADYNTIVGGGKIAPATFSDMSKHPGIVGYIGPDGKTSTAAGKYQITEETYNDVAKQLGITDFSPISQDKIATFLLYRAKALQDVYEGRFEAALEKIGGVWASAPSSKYNQPKKSRDWFRNEIAKFPASLTDVVNTGALSFDKNGRFGVSEDMRKQSNAVAKANTPKDTERLQKELERATADVDRLTGEIGRLTTARGISGTSVEANRQIDAQLTQAKQELQAALQVQEQSRIKLAEPTNREAEKGVAVDQRDIAQASADKYSTASAVDLQGYTTRLEKITSNRDFYLSRKTTEEELQTTQGLPKSRALMVEREQMQQRLLQALSDELEARIAESEAALKTKGLTRQEFDARVTILDQTRALMKNTKDALSASKERSEQFDRRDLELAKQSLDARYQLLAEQRDSLASAGRLNEFAGEMESVEKDLLDTNLKLLKKRQEKEGLPAGLIDLEQARLKSQFDESRFRARMQDSESKFRLVESGFTSFSPDKQFEQSYRASSGEALSLAEQRLYASNLLGGYGALRQSKQDEIAIQSGIAADKTKSFTERSDAERRIALLNTELQDLAKRAGEAAAKVADLNPTLGGELGQVSGQSIAAKISELPQALKNLNTNIENRFVTAVDEFSTALFSPIQDLIDSMFGLNQSVDKLSGEMKAVGDAQLNLSDVQSRSIDVAQQIEDIKRNESDPARQEYLIKRAMQAQQQAEAIAQQQVVEAQNKYDQAQFDQSSGGKMLTVAKNLVSGLAEDVFKGTVLGSFTSLFTDAFGGQPKGTKLDPIYVKMSDDLSKMFGSLFGTGGSAGTNGGGSWLGSLGSLFGSSGGQSSGGGLFGSLGNMVNAFSSFGSASSTVPGLSSNAAFAGPPTADVAGGISSASSFGSAFGMIGGLATIASNVMQMLQYKTGGAVKVPAYSTGGSPIATSDKGFVTGPGTSTSDSVPAFVSKDEYILNARTTAAIGKDTLDAWNFKNQYPMKFATGGMVSPLQRSVRDARAQDVEKAVVNHKSEPVTIRPILVDDHRRVEDFLNTPSGERAMVAFVKRNSLSLRQILQS